MKKVLSLFMSLIMLISITAGLDLTVSAETSGDFKYNVLDNGTAEIIDYTGSAVDLIIPSTLDGHVVTSVGHDFGKSFLKDGIVTISIPSSVLKIRYSGLTGINSLESIYVDENNPVFSSKDGVLFNKNMTRLIRYPESKKDSTYIIPDGVIEIGTPPTEWGGISTAFEECKFIKELYIPNSVTSIYAATFFNSSLENIHLSENISSLNDQVFKLCRNLKEITIPKAVKIIDDEAFSQCTSLEKVVLSECVEEIGDSAFYNCDSLKSIYIPQSVKDIGSKAFGYTFSFSEEGKIIWDVKVPDFTIFGYKSSEAYSYAYSNSFTFIDVENKSNEIPIETRKILQSQEVTNKVQTTKPASVKVSGKVYKLDKNGDYVSSKVKKPSISKATKAKKSFKVAWKKISAVSGYQVQYSTSKKFTKKTTKTKTVKGNKSKKPSLTVKNLKAKKTYYVRVRTYKTVKVNGKSTKVYSSWSKVKSVKTK